MLFGPPVTSRAKAQEDSHRNEDEPGKRSGREAQQAPGCPWFVHVFCDSRGSGRRARVGGAAAMSLAFRLPPRFPTAGQAERLELAMRAA